MDSLILIGTEIAAGNPHTDVSEFPDKWLSGVFQSATTSHLVPLNIHEYVHFQQKKTVPQDLLGFALREGAADYIAELVIRQKATAPNRSFILKHALPLPLLDNRRSRPQSNRRDYRCRRSDGCHGHETTADSRWRLNRSSKSALMVGLCLHIHLGIGKWPATSNKVQNNVMCFI